MKHTIDHEPLQNILNYLGTRPYNEVAQLIKDLVDSISLNKPYTKAFPDKEPDNTDPEPK